MVQGPQIDVIYHVSVKCSCDPSTPLWCPQTPCQSNTHFQHTRQNC